MRNERSAPYNLAAVFILKERRFERERFTFTLAYARNEVRLFPMKVVRKHNYNIDYYYF